MNKHLFLLLLILIILWSCNKTTPNFSLKKELTFNLDYVPLPKYSGIYYDKQKLKEYLYFADPVSKKCIKFFDEKIRLVDSIPLKYALDTLNDINGISIISLDTILIASLRTNKIVVINRLGKVWRYINLNEIVKEEKGNEYVFSFSSLSNFNLSNTSLILNCEWRYNIKDRINNLEPKSHFEEVKYYCDKSYDTPYYLFITNLFDSIPKTEFAIDGFYKHISNSADIFVEPSFYKYLDQSIFMYSTFSNKLFKINPITKRISQEIEIKSKYTSFTNKPIKVSKETQNTFQESLNYNGKTKGSINRIFFDGKNKEFYLIVFHELKDKTVIKTRGYFRPFSVMIYNQDFTKSNEYNFSDSINYEGYRAILTQNGLMIPIKNKTENDKFTFKLFEFNK